jgi:peptidoglycan/LPS O-acetylase OafA/YrhL
MKWKRIWTGTPLVEAFSSRNNSFNFLRLVLALAVLVSHSWPIALSKNDPGLGVTHGQARLGEFAVLGFFIISGFLITRSAIRFKTGRYLWHRGLRILPGLWVCLIVTAFVVGPIVALIQRGTLAGYWGAADGPVQYVLKNLFIAVRQYTISGLITGERDGHPVLIDAFNGSLWTLIYEVLCYFMVGGLALLGIFKRARWAVLAAAAVGFLIIVYDMVTAPAIPGPQGTHGPIFGHDGLDTYYLIYLTYLFLVGALIELYKDKIILSDGLGITSAVVLLVTLRFGGFFVLGYLATAYLIFWLAVRLPPFFRRIGRRHDYSYGVYIYAFPVQQIFAVSGLYHLGMVVYLAVCTLGTFALAVPSWHFVEKRAMAYKDWTPWFLRRSATPASVPAVPAQRVPVATEPAEPATPMTTPVDAAGETTEPAPTVRGTAKIPLRTVPVTNGLQPAQPVTTTNGERVSARVSVPGQVRVTPER